jgi:hypothetical protein
LNKTTSVGARFVRKWADYAIESVCQVEASGWACGVNNPGYGTGRHPVADGPDQPPARRVYDALEVRLRKRLANRWSLDASYVYSRLWGNWSGVASSDEALTSTPLQPNCGLAFNLLYYSYDASRHVTYGLLGTDRPHQAKLTATYDLPWGTMLGLTQVAESGIPQSTIMDELSQVSFFPYGRGDRGRTPFYTQTNLLVQQRVPLPGHRLKLTVGANVFNLFDQKTVLTYAPRPYRDALGVPDAQFFAGFDPVAYVTSKPSIRTNARFGMASGFQGSRYALLQAKLAF